MALYHQNLLAQKTNSDHVKSLRGETWRAGRWRGASHHSCCRLLMSLESGVKKKTNKLISQKKRWEEGRALSSHNMETQVSTDLTPQVES